MRNSEYYSAVYLLLENSKWEILFMKRLYIWFMDWKYWLLNDLE